MLSALVRADARRTHAAGVPQDRDMRDDAECQCSGKYVRSASEVHCDGSDAGGREYEVAHQAPLGGATMTPQSHSSGSFGYPKE